MTPYRAAARTLGPATLVACFALALPLTAEAAYTPCQAVVNPYAGSRYEGSDLYRIRARDVSCRTARRVARQGHYKALGEVPDRSGLVFVTYRRWSITGDLRGDHDRYVAKAAGGKRVRWLF